MATADGPRAEVIAIGDELTTGARLDTNSRWISAELAVLGIHTAFHTTAPDTLGCFPYVDKHKDPFVIQALPHVYFAGNQPAFQTKLLEAGDSVDFDTFDAALADIKGKLVRGSSPAAEGWQEEDRAEAGVDLI